jgi:hypothetical protein
MDRDDIGTGLGKGLQIGLGRGDHQMHIKGHFGVLAQRFDQAGAEGDIGHKMPIHDVEMQPIRAGGLHRAHLLGQPAEVGGKKAGANAGGWVHLPV